MKPVTKRYKTVKAFGAAIGLTEIDMELIRQKKAVIEKLRRARQKKGLSQSKLASLVHSKQPAIARMESGQVSEVSMDFLLKVALVLGVAIFIKPFEEAA